MPFLADDGSLHPPGCPIRRSEDQSLLAAPSRVSSLGTSFIGTPPLGIPQTPYVSLDPSRAPRALRPPAPAALRMKGGGRGGRGSAAKSGLAMGLRSGARSAARSPPQKREGGTGSSADASFSPHVSLHFFVYSFVKVRGGQGDRSLSIRPVGQRRVARASPPRRVRKRGGRGLPEGKSPPRRMAPSGPLSKPLRSLLVAGSIIYANNADLSREIDKKTRKQCE